MNEIVQATLAIGYGGLELIALEFHEWLLRNGVPARIIVAAGTPLERNLLSRGYRDSTVSVGRSFLRYRAAAAAMKELDRDRAAFLIHRHQDLKSLLFYKPSGKVTVLNHTFYGVNKKDLFHRFIFSRADLWIVLTPAQRENLLDTSPVDPGRVAIIPNGVDLSRFSPRESLKSPGPEAGPLQIGIVARLDPQKGQDLAIRALALLKKDFPRPVRLHFIGANTPGETPMRPVLDKLARELGVEDSVVYDGFFKDLSKRLRELAVVWMPSWKETFGRCIPEAMASGVPVVASNAGGVPDIIEDGRTGLLFRTKDAADLAEKTRLLLSDPDLYERLAGAALADARERYDIEKIWRRLTEAVRNGRP
ncbi:MAG: glycosyl transferase group 1 [Elusimicrobia bacterium]|nr:MAG: glycosyl transferase group 1 [Elusimicrobiota bacterium]KAF0158219.1 MAG: glycosyl transferase group 1 [Elusimicrobiota bacterium]